MTNEPAVPPDFISKRKKAIFRRWCEVLGYGLLASLLFLLLVWCFQKKVEAMATIPGWVLLVMTLLILVLMFYLAWGRNSWRWGAFLGIRYFWAYPPVWVGAVLGYALSSLGIAYFVIPGGLRLPDGAPLCYWYSGCSCIGVTLVLLLVAYRKWHAWVPAQARPQPDPFESSNSHSLADLADFEGLRKWLKDDKPIESPDGDQFGHKRIAKRMADRMCETPVPSQAVVGLLGSGKTTLGRLVRTELSKPERKTPEGLPIRLIQVELWSYETPSAAVEGILKLVLDAMNEDVSVLALCGIPAQYVEAMHAGGGWWEALSRIVQGSPSRPVDTLERIDQVATAIGIRYVIWVEDLERFAAAEHKGSDKGSERLQPILAILQGLNERHSLSVVTATTHLSNYFDLEKIARHVVEMPKIEAQDAARIISMFRKECLSWPGFIDTAPGVRKDLDLLESAAEAPTLFDPEAISVFVYFALLVIFRTPRTLKQGLRRCLDFWDDYIGEVDFDDLLVMCLLQEGVPSAFTYVRDHREALRSAPGNPFPSTNEGQALRTALTASLQDETAINAAIGIVGFVFGESASSKKPQGFATTREDYWRRFLNESDLDPEERDQPLLRILTQGSDEEVLGLLESSTHIRTLRDFRALLGPDRLKRLFPILVDRRSGDAPTRDWVQGSGPSKTYKAPGIENLWVLWLDLKNDGCLTADDLWPLIAEAIPKSVLTNLTLASCLDCYFVVPERSTGDALISGGVSRREDARRLLQDCFLETYSGQPEKLAQALEFQSPYALVWLIWGLERIRENGTDINAGRPVFGGELPFPKERWEVFADTLLKAVSINPKACLPPMASLLVHTFMGFEEPRYGFNEELTVRLFGSEQALKRSMEGERPEDWEDAPAVQELLSPKNPIRLPPANQ